MSAHFVNAYAIYCDFYVFENDNSKKKSCEVFLNFCSKQRLCNVGTSYKTNEPSCEKSGTLHMRKQRRRSASR